MTKRRAWAISLVSLVWLGACESAPDSAGGGAPPPPPAAGDDASVDARANDGAPAGEAGGEGDAGVAPVTSFTIDTPNVVRRSNIVLSHANTAPQQFMPIGNGTLAASVWAADGMTAQLNRWDTLPDRKSLGQVTIPGLAKLTSASDFHGVVDLYDGTLVESGGGMKAIAYVRADAAEMIVDVTGADPSATQTARIHLWSGRSPKAQANGQIALLAESWVDNSGLGASGQTFGSLAGITAGGRNVAASIVDPQTVQVSFQPNADGSFRIVVAAPAWSGAGDAMAAVKGAFGSDASAPSDALEAAHLAYWHDFWKRIGLIELTSPDGAADYFESLRTIYLYTMASGNRGKLPGSQAGVADMFAYLQDQEPWFPAGYWFWNTRMYVAANMTAGAFDMNTSVFDLYASNVANLKTWTTTKMGGKSGICVPETMRFNGNGYWVGGEGNSSCDQAASPSFNALTITSGAEIGLWIWQQYQMTGDKAFLSANYPVMSEAARFLLAYAVEGSDGLLHTTANAHETQWNVHDPVTDIVAMRTFFPALVAAAGVLGTDAPLVAQLQSAIGKIPPLPRTDAASHSKLLTAADDAAGQDVIAISYEPATEKHNGENLDLETAWPYGLIGDTGPDSDLAKRTFKSRMFVYGADWSYDALQAARLGLADEFAKSLTNVTQRYQAFVNGMALLGGGTNDGKSEPYLEQAGVTAAAINEALVQDYDGLLRIAPAWPADWDGAGTVFIHGGSKVDVQVKSGNVMFAILEAGSTASFQVRNPWPGKTAAAIDGASKVIVVPATSAATFALSTTAGHWYAIVPGDGASAPLPLVNVTGTPADKPKKLGPVAIGL